jgi:hypothetical protein
MLKAGKPEALKITVGNAIAPPIGPPGKVATVSLTPAALMKGPTQPSVVSAPPPALPPAAPKLRPKKPATTAPAAAPAPAETSPTTNTGE